MSATLVRMAMLLYWLANTPLSDDPAIRLFAGPTDAIRSVRFVADNELLTGGYGGVVLWNVDTMSPGLILSRNPARYVFDASRTADHARIVAAGYGGHFRSFDASSGQELTAFSTESEARRVDPWTCRLSPDGTLGLIQTAVGSLELWNVATGQRSRVIADPSPSGRVCWTAAAFSSDAAYLAYVRADGAIFVRELASATLVTEIHTGVTANAVAIAPDKSSIVLGNSAGEVLVYGIPDGKPLKRWKAHDRNIQAVALDCTGCRLATGDGKGLIVLWDVGPETPRGEELSRTQRDTSCVVFALAFSDDGCAVAFSAHDPDKTWPRKRELGIWTVSK